MGVVVMIRSKHFGRGSDELGSKLMAGFLRKLWASAEKPDTIAFYNSGVHLLADDSDVGRGRINEYLCPDRDTLSPRIHVHPLCTRAIFQMKRYIWDDFRNSLDKGLKQKPKQKNDDDPTMMKYVLNSNPTSRGLLEGGRIVRRRQRLRQRSAQQQWAERDRGQRWGRP